MGLPHYPGWELRFRLKLPDDSRPEESCRGYLLVRSQAEPFFSGEIAVVFALAVRNRELLGGGVPAMNVNCGDATLQKYLADLFHEFDPEAWPSLTG